MTDNSRLKTNSCTRCGTEIPKNYGQKYCSACAKIVEREQTLARKAKKQTPLPIKACAACGKKFTDIGHRKYCGKECAAAGRRRLEAEYKRRERQDNQLLPESTAQYRTGPLRKKSLTLTELAAAAAAAGLTYGKYVALMMDEKGENGKIKPRR